MLIQRKKLSALDSTDPKNILEELKAKKKENEKYFQTCFSIGNRLKKQGVS